jgi:hypothetical protein
MEIFGVLDLVKLWYLNWHRHVALEIPTPGLCCRIFSVHIPTSGDSAFNVNAALGLLGSSRPTGDFKTIWHLPVGLRRIEGTMLRHSNPIVEEV